MKVGMAVLPKAPARGPGCCGSCPGRGVIHRCCSSSAGCGPGGRDCGLGFRRLAVIVEAVAARGAIVPPVAGPPPARATSSSIIPQLAISVTAGMVTVEEAIAVP